MSFTIVVPYRDREEAYQRIKASTSRRIVIANEIADDEIFSTGLVQNAAIKHLDGWILKQDVDCTATEELYEAVDRWTRSVSNTTDDYLCIGADYGDRVGKKWKRKAAYEMVFHKDAWEAVGGVPEFDGYGWEDITFVCLLQKNINRRFRIPGVDIDNFWHKMMQVKEDIVVSKNEKIGMYFKHHWHPIEYLSEYMRLNALNMKRSYELLYERGIV